MKRTLLIGLCLSLLLLGFGVRLHSDSRKSYIVTTKSRDVHQRHGLNPSHVYQFAIIGFAAQLNDSEIAALRNDPDVRSVEADGIRTAQQQITPPGISRIAAPQNAYFGLATNIDIAIIDTGVDSAHPDLNVVSSVDFTGEGAFDGFGHGTHVAGIAAAKNNGFGVVGVAPGARIHSVKVLDSSGSGTTADIIAGLDYVAQHANEIEVANESIGGFGYTQAERDAVAGCVNAGVVMIVAAGNSRTDIYGNDHVLGTGDDFVPAAYPEAMAISAMADTDGIAGGLGSSTTYGLDDQAAYFSNFSFQADASVPITSWGAAISLAAPGVNVLSTVPTGTCPICDPSGYRLLSGTSMASPHVAGSVALYIAEHGRALNAAGVVAIRQAMINRGQPQYLWRADGDTLDADYNHEFLVWNGSVTWPDPGPPPPPPPPPNAPSNLVGYRDVRFAHISWADNSSNESGFEVYMMLREPGKPWPAGWQWNAFYPPDVTLTNWGISKKNDYRFKVRATGGSTPSDWSNTLELLSH